MALTLEDLEARRHSIGSSDAPAVLGVSRWRKPIDVWAEKTGIAPIDESRLEDDPYQEWGRLLEPVLVAKAAAELGLRVRKGRFRRNPLVPYMTATPDAESEEAVIEAKTSRSEEGYGEPGTDEIPLDYKVQVIHELIVTRKRVAHVPVLIRGNDFRLFTLRPTGAELAAVQEAEVEFWTKYVVPKVEPPELSDEYVRMRWRHEDAGTEAVATDDLVPVIERLRLAKMNEKTAKAAAGELEVTIMRRMEGIEKLIHPYGSITWKTGKPRTDWKLVAGAFREMLLTSTSGAIIPRTPEMLDAIVGLHTAPEGTRVFRPYWKEGDEE